MERASHAIITTSKRNNDDQFGGNGGGVNNDSSSPLNMNLVSQFVGVALNFFMSPFNLIGYTNPLIKASPATCTIGIFKFGENEMKVSLVPRGFCPNCCPIRSDDDIRFRFYNKANNGVIIERNKVGAAQKAGVNSTSPTIIFVHGFSELSPGHSGRTIVDAYLSRDENYNVILLDWSHLGTFPWYTNAVTNVKYVAEILKDFLEIFHKNGEIPIENVHIVGFSLGSHVAGLAGKRLTQNGIKIPRITALDPAFPEYSVKDRTRRITRTDAEFIDVIHTDAGVLGLPFAVGHADFYPNGGRALQPGCQPSYLVRLRLADQIFACSHVRAWQLYAESVRNPEAFPATKCRNWRGPNKTCNFTTDGMMGYPNNKRSQGQFYLFTNFRQPFAKAAERQTTD